MEKDVKKNPGSGALCVQTLEIGIDSGRLLELCQPVDGEEVYFASGSSPSDGSDASVAILRRPGNRVVFVALGTRDERPVSDLLGPPYSAMSWCAGVVKSSETPTEEEARSFLEALVKRSVFGKTPVPSQW